jgi:hypothetical protein
MLVLSPTDDDNDPDSYDADLEADITEDGLGASPVISTAAGERVKKLGGQKKGTLTEENGLALDAALGLYDDNLIPTGFIVGILKVRLVFIRVCFVSTHYCCCCCCCCCSIIVVFVFKPFPHFSCTFQMNVA